MRTDRQMEGRADRHDDENIVFAVLRGLKERTGFSRSVTRSAHNETGRKVPEIIHVAEGIEKRMLNRRAHLWKTDISRLPSIVRAGLK